MKRVVLILCLTVVRAWSQTTQIAPADAQKLPGMLQAELDVLGIPVIRAESVTQLVSFGVERDFLSATTELKIPSRNARVLVQGLRGVVRIMSFGPEEPDQPASSFSVLQRDLTDPLTGDVITTISSVAGRLMVSRDSEVDEGATASVQLIQEGPPAPGEIVEDDPVRLIVTKTAADGRQAVNLKVSAATFSELRRRHGDVVDAYLRPIFRDYGQEGAVFGVPDAIAWQVLGGKYAPDAEATARVQQIVASLDADQFRDRVAAMNELRALGQPAALVLLRLDRSRFSLQQNSAIDTFLAEFAPLGADQSRSLATDVSFLIDVLYTNDAALRKLAQDQLSLVTGSKVQLDQSASPSARADAITRLRKALMPTTQPG